MQLKPEMHHSYKVDHLCLNHLCIQNLCLSPSEEFNDKILSPDLSDSELQRLHGEVLHIYETYCLDESIDKISFDKFIVEEIRNSKRTSCDRHQSSS